MASPIEIGYVSANLPLTGLVIGSGEHTSKYNIAGSEATILISITGHRGIIRFATLSSEMQMNNLCAPAQAQSSVITRVVSSGGVLEMRLPSRYGINRNSDKIPSMLLLAARNRKRGLYFYADTVAEISRRCK
jgi:hypothetical protein